MGNIFIQQIKCSLNVETLEKLKNLLEKGESESFSSFTKMFSKVLFLLHKNIGLC